MKATFVLTPAEARRLIAKAVIQMPEFQKAWKDDSPLLLSRFVICSSVASGKSFKTSFLVISLPPDVYKRQV